MGAAGTQGTGNVAGGAQGFTGESEISEKEGEARGFQRGQKFEARAGIEGAQQGAVDTSGYSDPVSEAGRVEQLEHNQRDGVAGKAQASTEKVDEAQRVAADPKAAATGEASLRIDQKTGDARRDAGEVGDVARDPESAVQAGADAKVAEQQRAATAKATGNVSVSSDGSASASTSTDKPGDKK